MLVVEVLLCGDAFFQQGQGKLRALRKIGIPENTCYRPKTSEIPFSAGLQYLKIAVCICSPFRMNRFEVMREKNGQMFRSP